MNEETESLEEYLHFAKSAVREAALLVKGMSHQSTVRYSKDLGDLVTDGDLAVHEYVSGQIRYAYPDHHILSEEDDEHSYEGDYLWILDPIDGTKYFSRGIPLYSISLGLQIKGKLVVGVVFNPETGQIFSAFTGGGAYLNGLPIKCSANEKLDQCIVYTEGPSRHDPDDEREQTFEKIRTLTEKVLRVRMIGAAAHGLCWTAMGGFDAYINLKTGTRIWDIAAGIVIMQEAGAKITNLNGRIVGAAPAIHDQLVDLLDLHGMS